MTRQRRTFTAEQKAEAVRRHLRDKVAVSDLAEELGVQPSQIHQWVAAVLGQAEKAFAKDAKQDKRRQAKSLAIGGLKIGRSRRSSTFTTVIRWKATGD